MYQLASDNPGLAQVIGAMDVINPVTPEGAPTVASQVMQAAQQAMAPQMPQMQQAPQMPNVQDIAQDAGIGNQVQMQQQQAQQQEMMQAMQQMMQQRDAQDNAMRFGVAAAPGAQSVRMAEGGIVGYAEGEFLADEVERLNKMTPEERRAYMKIKAAQRATAASEIPKPVMGGQPAAAAAAEAAPAARGIMPLIRAVGSKALGPAAALYGVYDALKDPESRAQTEDFFRGVLGFGPANAPHYSHEGRNAMIERVMNENYSNEGRNYPGPVEDRFGIADLMRAGQEGGAAPGAGGPRMPMPAAPTGPRKSDEYATGMRNILAGFETGGVKPGDVVTATREQDAAREAYLREMGVDPRQFEKDLATSEARRNRRLQGIEQLEGQSKEARSGINRLMEVLAAGSGRVVPGAMGQQYVNMLRRDLAENERFMNARERVQEAEDQIQMAVRDKRRAEVMGNLKEREAALQREQDARNKKREAELTMTTELYKTERKSEEGALDRQQQVAIEQFRASVQRDVNAGLKREQLLRNIDADRNRYAQGFEKLYREKVRDLGIIDPSKPSPEQRQALNKLEAERDAAIAKLEAEAAQERTRVMGGSGAGTSGIKVEPIKSSK